MVAEGFAFDRGHIILGSMLSNHAGMQEVLRLAAEGKVRTLVDRFPMAQANDALDLLAAGKLRSRAVLFNA